MFFSHLTVSLQKQILNIMGDDVFKSISQRIDGTHDEENRRIKEISDELQKLCRLYEAQLRDGKENVNCYEIEQRPRWWRGGYLCDWCRNKENLIVLPKDNENLPNLFGSLIKKKAWVGVVYLCPDWPEKAAFWCIFALAEVDIPSTIDFVALYFVLIINHLRWRCGVRVSAFQRFSWVLRGVQTLPYIYNLLIIN